MTKCINCVNNSAWIYEITPAQTVPYCGEHLPKFLHDRKNAGLLKSSDEMVQEQSDAFEALAPKSSKKTSKAVVEEPVVEEPVVEEEPTTPEE